MEVEVEADCVATTDAIGNVVGGVGSGTNIAFVTTYLVDLQ